MRRSILVSFLLAFATFAAYWPVRHADFLNFDDAQYITNNPKVFLGLSLESVRWAFTTFHAANWHPLTWMSHMLDCQIFSDNAGAHHLVNVAFHSANSVLLFILLLRLTRAFVQSAFVAALFALHPLHVESVAWVAERKDVLSAFFFFLTLLAYAAYVRAKFKVPGELTSPSVPCVLRFTTHFSNITPRAPFFYLLALFLFGLGLMSKPMLVTLPFVLLLLDFWPLKRLPVSAFHFPFPAFKGLLLEKIPFLFLAVASSIITFYSQKRGGAVVNVGNIPVEARLENAGLSCLWYLVKAFWPARLAAFYPYPPELRLWPALGAVVVLVTITAIILWLARRAPYSFVGWFWYLGTLVPVIGLVQVGSQVAADRYTYLPLIGIFIIVTWGAAQFLVRWRYHRPVLVGIGASILAACFLATSLQVRYWHDSVTLFTRALEISPGNNPIAHHNLGHSLSLAGNQREAIIHFQEALRIRMDFPTAHLNWGNSVAIQGDIDQAIIHYRDAIKYQPDYEMAWYQLGNALALEGKLDEAEASFREAIHFKPDYAEAFLKLANVLDIKGKTLEALSNWRASLNARPDFDEAHYYLAGSLARQKEFSGAITHLRAAIKANPRYAAACNDLAWILASQTNESIRNLPDSLRLARHACELSGQSNPSYLDTLAVALSESGRFAEAVDAEAKAIDTASSSANPAISAQLKKHLELFRGGMPYHSSIEANP